MKNFPSLKGKKIVVTGGAGFIGSNLCEFLISQQAQVRCLDNFATGHRHNIEHLLKDDLFELLEGDIRDLQTCQQACEGVDFVLHQAALGSVPRSIADPITTNAVNVGGFLNMLVAARDQQVKRLVYAASSSTYGDSTALPKVEENIGQPLSPYAITKYVDELYAQNFKLTYNLDTVGLRYFNVFGRKQDPQGAYAAVIPKFVQQFMKHESPQINGDGTYSRDFTYIDNVIQMNMRALTTENTEALNQVYNTAVGDRTTILSMAKDLRSFLAEKDSKIAQVEILHGPNRQGDVPHSLASIEKAQHYMGYVPTHRFQEGLKEAVDWYWEHL
ncbi:SDR family oxidoreductase [Mesonia aestuariivivens]|uniref:SDR family oxidoreductase n=1 Tax=Mesonia aestuariivivens TaxID=2796128 RepID=A0ABS6W5S7_9FLAO|nr:SDR family oxidoreductase [Mesonia aestuariivivens]MBW2962882.1 SDR family oxidoreductase [Mesonia aestuariivivens]